MMSKIFGLALFITISAASFMGQVRGYLTTPTELQTIATKAAAGTEPYHSAVLQIKNYANTYSMSLTTSTKNATVWTFGTGTTYGTSCPQGDADTPAWLGSSNGGGGGRHTFAKVLVWQLTGDTDYANDAIVRLRAAYNSSATTADWGGEVYGGNNQCILNLAHYIPDYVMAADLLEGYSGWTSADKTNMVNWLSGIIYKRISWADEMSKNNWGSSASAAAAAIADYVYTSGHTLTDWHGNTITAATAWANAKQHWLDRANGNSYMTMLNCAVDGIRPDGGIPDELARGTPGCNGLSLAGPYPSCGGSDDNYTWVTLSGMTQQAELFLRRGDSSLYDNIQPDNSGSIKRAYLFSLANPNVLANSCDGPGGGGYTRSPLEWAYRYYRNPVFFKELTTTGSGTAANGLGSRFFGGTSNRMAPFGTLLAGFAVGENPGPPPTVPPPTVGELPTTTPTAVLVVSPMSGTAPLTVTADSSRSYENGGTITSRTIDFGDGTAKANSTSATHTYSTAGTFVVTLTIADSAGNIATAIKTVAVTLASPPPPTTSPATPTAVLVVSPMSGTAPLTVTADSSRSYENGGTITSRTIDFGDATAKATSTSATHTYSAVGTFTVKLTVGDSAGNMAIATETVIVTSPAPSSPPPTASGSRGYVTTPIELNTIAAKATQGIEPYRSAVLAVENFANTGSSSVAASTPNPTYWPYGTISGSQSCTGTYQPAFVGNGNALIEAKVFTYWLTGDTRYADNAIEQIRQLATTSYYNGELYSGANQCILNLGWYIPSWIIAADLLEGYPGWTALDKQKFQNWLAREVYKKVDWASDARSNNWGAAGSLSSGMIADYLSGSGIPMVDRTGAAIGAAAAYLQAKQRQLDRMDGNTYMDNYGCRKADKRQGYRPDGGIPWELGRGSTGCDGMWILAEDASWTYTITDLGPAMSYAEFLLRRGDSSIYNNMTSSGAGSLLRAIYFVIHNPNSTSASLPWKSNRRQGLEMVYRYYATRGQLDPYIGQQLGIGTRSRYVGSENNPNPHFGTLTHGFAVGEQPTLPPTVPPPTN